MGKQQIHFEFDEHIWQTFQSIYPRQATGIFHDIMKSMINFKLDITDEEGEQLRLNKEELQRKADIILTQLRNEEMKLKIWEANKRKNLLEEKQIYDEQDEKASSIIESIRASGILARGSK